MYAIGLSCGLKLRPLSHASCGSYLIFRATRTQLLALPKLEQLLEVTVNGLLRNWLKGGRAAQRFCPPFWPTVGLKYIEICNLEDCWDEELDEERMETITIV